jgi:hypothetical protein
MPRSSLKAQLHATQLQLVAHQGQRHNLNCVLTAGPTWTGTRACSSHLYYVEDWRTGLDIRILAKTPSAVLRGAETHLASAARILGSTRLPGWQVLPHLGSSAEITDHDGQLGDG